MAGGILAVSCRSAGAAASGDVMADADLDPDRPAGARGFDFLFGRWDVRNSVLRQRLAGSNEWDEWPASLIVWPVLRGWGNVDRFDATRNGKAFSGTTVRLYRPDVEEWELYWMDNVGHRLLPQTGGAMRPDGGTFYGQEPFQDREVRLRFIWSRMSDTTARWEQAYAELGSDEWETNWKMEFEKRG